MTGDISRFLDMSSSLRGWGINEVKYYIMILDLVEPARVWERCLLNFFTKQNSSSPGGWGRENALQRGNTGTALAGSVAAAIRFTAKAVLTGVGSEQLFRSSDLPELRGNLTSDRGLGRDIIVRFLKKVPGVTDRTVQEQLANLKASGDYARIIRHSTTATPH
jgi:hypothetical protein